MRKIEGPPRVRLQHKQRTLAAMQARPRDPSLLIAVILCGVAFCFLPVWDAVERYSLLRAMSGAFGASGPRDVPFPPAGLGYPLAALALGFAIHRRFHSSKAMALGLFALGVAVVALYAGATGISAALTRSHAVDTWVVCETGAYPDGRKAFVSTHTRATAFDGPHLDNGDPCTLQSENRLAHLTAHPDGSVLDGLVQIWKRFPNDRLRVLWGSLAACAMLVAAGSLLRRARASSE